MRKRSIQTYSSCAFQCECLDCQASSNTEQPTQVDTLHIQLHQEKPRKTLSAMNLDSERHKNALVGNSFSPDHPKTTRYSGTWYFFFKQRWPWKWVGVALLEVTRKLLYLDSQTKQRGVWWLMSSCADPLYLLSKCFSKMPCPHSRESVYLQL